MISLHNRSRLLFTAVPAVALLLLLAAGCSEPQQPVTERATDKVGRAATAETRQVAGPGAAPMDIFHPANQPDAAGNRPEQPTPMYGGRVIIHMSAMPKNMCYPIENSAWTRRVLYDVHETLVQRDWEMWDYKPVLSRSWDTEDMLVLTPEAAPRYKQGAVDVRVRIPKAKRQEGGQERRDARVLYGRVEDEGASWLLTPVSKGHPLAGPVSVPKEHVDHLEQGTVFTFHLRDDAVWHPSLLFSDAQKAKLAGHKLDARDVLFSWQLYQNPEVDCDRIRFQYEKIPKAEIVDDLTVRFFYEEQYYLALDAIGSSLTILPSHVYNLSDPQNPDHNPKAGVAEQAKHINENPHNLLWVGLGPYQVSEYGQQWVDAKRHPDYFDKQNAGYFDAIRWRYISDDNTAFQALLNGEIDFFERVKSEDYFGAATEKPAFTDNFYKGYFYLGSYGYTGWNLYRPQLADVAVRKAMAHAVDLEEYKRTQYKGLCNQTTGPFPYNSLAYDHSVKPYPYDPEMAIEILEEAGWYDRNGDGIRDKDGVELEIEFMMPSGNEASKSMGLTLQESLAKINIKLNIVQYEWATLLERILDREFDAINLAWVPDLESDPEQLWSSALGKKDVRSSNHSGVMDPYLDQLIAQGQRELDKEKRQEIWHKMHRHIYELQPYLFMYNVPRKFAMTKRIRGNQTFAIDPAYSPRRWYFTADEPGTRPEL